jgi:hypothetical protein
MSKFPRVTSFHSNSIGKNNCLNVKCSRGVIGRLTLAFGKWKVCGFECKYLCCRALLEIGGLIYWVSIAQNLTAESRLNYDSKYLLSSNFQLSSFQNCWIFFSCQANAMWFWFSLEARRLTFLKCSRQTSSFSCMLFVPHPHSKCFQSFIFKWICTQKWFDKKISHSFKIIRRLISRIAWVSFVLSFHSLLIFLTLIFELI